jgi:hypothetical protein
MKYTLHSTKPQWEQIKLRFLGGTGKLNQSLSPVNLFRLHIHWFQHCVAVAQRQSGSTKTER